MSVHPLFSVTAFALLAGQSLPSETQTIGKRTANAEITDELKLLDFQVDPSDRMTLPIELSDGRTYDFMIDTGAEQSAISREVAQQLGLSVTGARQVISFAGSSRVETVTIPFLPLAKQTHHDVDALLLGRSAIGADGLLGMDSLKDQFVTFDFKSRQMRLQKPTRYSSFSDRNTVRVDLTERNGRMVMSDAQASGVSVDVILDTGSGLSIGNDALRQELLRKKKLGTLEPRAMLTVTGRIVPIEYGVLRDVVIDGVEIIYMPIAFAMSEPFDSLDMADQPTLILGMDVLRSFGQISVDFANKRAYFRGRDSSQYKPGSYWAFVDHT